VLICVKKLVSLIAGGGGDVSPDKQKGLRIKGVWINQPILGREGKALTALLAEGAT